MCILPVAHHSYWIFLCWEYSLQFTSIIPRSVGLDNTFSCMVVFYITFYVDLYGCLSYRYSYLRLLLAVYVSSKNLPT